jgi:Fur family peroxide stress response transcriptional regulator
MKITGSIFSKIKEKELETMCREHGLALTIQRRTILEALAARSDHPTADQIYEAIKDLLKGVSKTTVYRVLETFVSFGIVRKVSNPEAKARFDADTSRHHHATCLHCGLVMDVHDQDLNKLKFPLHIEKGFDFVDYSINFTGLCTLCRPARGCVGPRNKMTRGGSEDEVC